MDSFHPGARSVWRVVLTAACAGLIAVAVVAAGARGTPQPAPVPPTGIAPPAPSAPSIAAPPSSAPPSTAPTIAPRTPASALRTPPYAPGEVLVKFRAGTKSADKSAALVAMTTSVNSAAVGSASAPGAPSTGASALPTPGPGAVRKWTFRRGAEHWRLPPGLPVEDAIARLRARPDVE